MKKLFLFVAILLTGLFSKAQSVRDLSFGTDTTLEIITWNLQGFPKNGQTTVDYVKQIIESLDVDIVAIQEVDDNTAFRNMVSGMASYDGFVAPNSFAGLGYIYKKGIIEINDIYEIYSAGYSRPFPRTPLLMDMKYEGERVVLINNHLKCCGDGVLDRTDPDDEETRRYDACVYLKEYIDSYLSDLDVVVMGDMNDEITDEPANNVFQTILDDGENYRFADMTIATGPSSGWSYPSWPSHIDHLLVTNELVDETLHPGSVIETIKAEEFLPGGWYSYENNLTDHRPVAMKLQMNLNLGLTGEMGAISSLTSYPNPFSTRTTFSFKKIAGNMTLEIINSYGLTVFTANLPAGTTSFPWNPADLPPGLYLARLLSLNTCMASRTILLKD